MSDEDFKIWHMIEGVGIAAAVGWFAATIKAFAQILKTTVTLNRLVEDAKDHDAKLDKVVTKVDVLGETVAGHHRAIDTKATRGKPDE